MIALIIINDQECSFSFDMESDGQITRWEEI